MDNKLQDFDIKKEIRTEIIFFVILFCIIGTTFLITKYKMNKAQLKIDNFKNLIIGTTYSGIDSILLNRATERYTIIFTDDKILNYRRTDSNYYFDDNNKIHFNPNVIYEDIFVPYEFKPTAMGKIVLIFENHIYYVKFNADGDIYIDFKNEPFSEKVDIILKEISHFINAF